MHNTKKLLFLLFLVLLPLQAADWTKTSPEVILVERLLHREALLIRVTVRFSDDASEPNTQEVRYTFQGNNISVRLAEAIRRDLETLQASDSLSPGPIDPAVLPTPDPLLQAFNEAVAKLDELLVLKEKGVTSVDGGVTPIDDSIAAAVTEVEQAKAKL